MKFEKALKKLELGYPVARSSMKDGYFFHVYYESYEFAPGCYGPTEMMIGLYRDNGEKLWSKYSFSYPEIIAEDWEIKE